MDLLSTEAPARRQPALLPQASVSGQSGQRVNRLPPGLPGFPESGAASLSAILTGKRVGQTRTEARSDQLISHP